MEDVIRKPDKTVKGNDPAFWLMASGLALISLWFPSYLETEADKLTPWILAEASLFFSGALVGCFRSDRVWRWGLAAFLTFALRDLILAANLSLDLSWVAPFLANHAKIYVLQTIPFATGAYIGSGLVRANVK